MNSRYGLCIVSICWISLAGCANWQNRAGTASSLGSAATQQPSEPFVADAPGVPPGTVFNTEPPPPVPPAPSDPNVMLAPLGSPQKLDLSEALLPAGGPERSKGSAPKKMYNLDSTPSRSTASSSSQKKSSTISKLASKAESKVTAKSSSGLSTVKKLSQDASESKGSSNESASAAPSETASVAPLPAEKASSLEAALPAPSRPVEPAASQAKINTAPAVVDTALLAQPVRKGSSSDKKDNDKESNGPQSSLSPRSKLFHEQYKPVIYPVSNPVAERPIDIIQFS